MEMNKIYCINCLRGMELLPEASVDITITSPPYNIGGKYALYKDNLTVNEYTAWMRKVIREMLRVTKYYVFLNFAVLTNNKLSWLELIGEFRLNIKEIIVWHKKQAIPTDITCLSSAFEFIIVLSNKSEAESRLFTRSFMNQIYTNVIYGNSNSVDEFNDAKVGNDACFPQYFVKWFIDKFSKEGDIILDPFIGSGTTAYVAKQNNRQFIGFDIDSEQVNVSNEKLKQITIIRNQIDINNWIDNSVDDVTEKIIEINNDEGK